MANFFKEWAFRKWYWYVSNIDKKSEVIFMNYGYSHPNHKLQLDDKDEVNRYSIQLYHQLARHVDLANKHLVEIGCGRGGGLSFVHRHFKPKSSTGIDLNDRAMKFASSFYKLNGLNFKQGNAQDIPLEDKSCDVVLNVESSHRYPDFPKFLSEVSRILKKDGHFIITDFRHKENYEAMGKSYKGKWFQNNQT